jgi:hypothetical protein
VGKKRICIILFAIIFVISATAGIIFAATNIKDRQSYFGFSFGDISFGADIGAEYSKTVTLSGEQVADFSENGDSLTFDITLTNSSKVGIGYSYNLAVTGDVLKSNILCSLNGQFIGTLAALCDGENYFGANICAPQGDVSGNLTIEYCKGLNEDFICDEFAITLNLKVTSLDSSSYSFISSAEELRTSLQSINSSAFGVQDRTYVLMNDISMPNATTFDITSACDININLYGHTLDFGGSSFAGGSLSLYSTQSGGSIKNMTVGEGAFVNFEEGITLDNIAVNDDIDFDSAVSYMAQRLTSLLYASVLDEQTAKTPFGNLQIYKDAVGATINLSGGKVTVCLNGNTYTATYGVVSADIVTKLNAIMAAQGALTDSSLIENFDVAYDLYLPTGIGGNNYIKWYSSNADVIDADGKYNKGYIPSIVYLTAAVFGGGTTSYIKYVIPAGSMSYQERIDYIASFSDLKLTINDKEDYVIFDLTDGGIVACTGAYIGQMSYFNLTSISIADENGKLVGDYYALSQKDDAWYITITGSAQKQLILNVTGTFEDFGISGSATCSIEITVDVQATSPQSVLETVQEQIDLIDVESIISNHLYCTLHATYGCGEGSFTLPDTFPLGSSVNAVGDEEVAEYILVYTADGIACNDLLGTTYLTTLDDDGNYNTISSGYIVDINPLKFSHVATSISITATVYVPNGLQAESDGQPVSRTFTIALPATFVEGDDYGFNSNATKLYGDSYIDYAFAKVRDLVDGISSISPSTESGCAYDNDSRRFILISHITSANKYITSLNISADEDIVVNTSYTISSINGISYFTHLEELNLSGTHIGDYSSVGSSRVKNTRLISSKTNLVKLNLANCDITDISLFAFTKLKEVYLNGNSGLRNISTMLYSLESIEVLDICDTAAVADIENDRKSGYYHSVLEQMYNGYYTANGSYAAYYIGGHSSEHKNYVPYTYDEQDSDDTIVLIAKEYAYRFDNIYEIDGRLLLQSKFIPASGEPSASIEWSIEELQLADGSSEEPLSMLSVTSYDSYKVITVNSTACSGGMIKLKMDVILVGRSYSRYFYLTIV